MNTRLNTLTGGVALLLCFVHGVASAQDATPCATPASGLFAERIHEEAARGMPSFARFVKRTRTVYQLDVATEIAKLDAERAACESRVAMTGTALPVASVRAETQAE